MEVHIYISAGSRCPKKMRRRVSYRLMAETSAGQRWRDGEKELEATLHQAELLALTESLGRLTRPCPLIIHTMSRYIAANLIEGRVFQWAKSGWTTAKGEAVANRAEWLEVLKILKGRPFRVVLEGCEGETDKKA